MTEPTVHTPAENDVPVDATTVGDVSPDGTVSDTVTPVAVLGPLLVSVTVNVMESPWFGVVSLTILASSRSATAPAVADACAESFPATLSTSFSAVTVAVLVIVAVVSAVPVMVKVSNAPLASEPTVQTPVPELYDVVPESVNPVNVSPAGSRSDTVTPVAPLGPLLVSVTVNVMESNWFGVVSLTILSTSRSTTAPTVAVAVAESFAESLSVSATARTEAVLGTAPTELTVPEIVRV